MDYETYVKWDPADPAIAPPIRAIYNPWNDAKDDLERNIGPYCSFCEKPVTDEGAHVEHIQPKSLAKYRALRYSWNNFLFACQRCNGTDNKGSKDVTFADLHIPHLSNTFKSIKYKEGGLVAVNKRLRGVELRRAQALIDLVGLDKRPGIAGYRPKDKRWERRRDAWEIAKRNLAKYPSHNDQQIIVDLAKGIGFWSVWMTVFKDHPNVVDALIDDFNGTYAQCRTKNVNRK